MLSSLLAHWVLKDGKDHRDNDMFSKWMPHAVPFRTIRALFGVTCRNSFAAVSLSTVRPFFSKANQWPISEGLCFVDGEAAVL